MTPTHTHTQHPLEFTAIFNKYIETFEQKIEKYIDSEGGSLSDFRKESAEIIERGNMMDQVTYIICMHIHARI
jgi:hypothetical protein